MAFLIHSIANENVVPWEYFPCSDALITGEVLALKDGKMVSATAEMLETKLPLYLSMCEKAAGEEEIPAVRIRDDMILEGAAPPEEGVDIYEGMRGYLVSVADIGSGDTEGIVDGIRKIIHASHVFQGMSSSDAEGEQHVLFEVVGVGEPELEALPIPKILIRLIG